MRETVTNMLNVYRQQVAKLKDDWKNGNSNLCEKDYKIQLNIWENRIKQYEEMLEDKRNEGLKWNEESL